MIARHGTANHVEKLVSKFRYVKRLQETRTANIQYANRELSYRYDENGSLVINASLPPEQGALIVKALEMAIERQFRDANVSAETSAVIDPDLSHLESGLRIWRQGFIC